MTGSALRLVKPVLSDTEGVDRPTLLTSELHLTIKEFLIAAKGEGKLPRTLRHYAWHLERLASWLSSRGVKRPADVSRLLLREWAASLYEPYTVKGLERTWGQAVIKQAITSARSYLKWLAKEGYIDDALPLAIKTPKIKRRQQRTLTKEQIEALHSACGESDRGKRDRALLGLLLDSGLRAAEVCRVEVGKLEYGVMVGGEKVNRVRVIIKGGNEEFAHFSDQTANHLKAWLLGRVSVPGVGTVFVSVGGNTPGYPLTVSGLQRALKYLGDKAGVKCSPHDFRRTFAVQLTELGVPSRAVQVLGRWSDIRMVEHYTSGLVAGRLWADVERRRLTT